MAGDLPKRYAANPGADDESGAHGRTGSQHLQRRGALEDYIAVSTSLEAGDYEEYTVPAATWAIFPGEGTNQSIQELERRIVTEWLPTSGYEYGNAPDIEVYLNPDPQNARYEVWIPVTKKQG